ncbi:MAG: DNA polymerase III subunit delta' [Chloroflexi bacterium]|nr:DNA polymerase III subunit delta' [Chloroflexota bacterium]MCC6893054.1 DNA polymerase III subunit delta' [Anaerolineae bacterium]
MSQHVWPVYGHEWAVEHLRKSIANQRIRHAYLIVGAESIGKETLARALAMTLNCTHSDADARPCGQCSSCKRIASGNHPDMIYSELDGTTGALKIEEIRNVTGKIALKPYEARYRVAILRDFDHARPQAQDALLKTLEEPPPQALLILLAPSTESLLATITSRSQIIHLRPLPVETIYNVLTQQYNIEHEQADLLARLSGGRMGWALQAIAQPEILEQRTAAINLLEDLVPMTRAQRFEIAEDLSKDKLALYPLLELWQSYWRDVLLLCEGVSDQPANVDRRAALEKIAVGTSTEAVLMALKATRTLITNLSTNLNLRLALEVMFLDYPGLPNQG